ncbi:hypothetical protein ACFCYB_13700 [Streptomyces sp. NPDC056309]|uniref:hypothetical protein n=1 Tax=unclassified Streptomyces TaxID=2593676 RepID=UPI0035E23F6E
MAEGSGNEDLRRHTDWQSRDGREIPGLDFNRVVRADNATRSLRCLVQVDAEGWDIEPHLRDASETVQVPSARVAAVHG